VKSVLKVARTLIERIARGRVLRRRLRVGGESIPILISPDAQLKYLKPGPDAFDVDLIQIAERFLQPGANAWDVGANVGVFTFAASAVVKTGTVVCIEADTWLANLLRRSTRLEGNRDRDIRVVPVALSRDVSVETFEVAMRGRASNALSSAGGRDQMGGVREIQYVPTTSLDRLLDVFPAPDLVKIDVEGAELMVMQGGERMLSECRPNFYVEVGREVAEEMASLFTRSGYSLFHGKTGESIDSCSRNTFFVPEEQVSEFQRRF